jgi:competence protein ComEA
MDPIVSQPMLRTLPLLLTACLFIPLSRADNDQLPDAPEKAILVRVCTTCHNVDAIPSLRHTKDEWQDLVDAMKGMGAEGSDQDFEAIVRYLAKNFGAKEEARININKATASEIETGLALTSKDAEAIVAYRKQHGDFKDWNDLVKVTGLDTAKLETAKSRIDY